MTKLFDAVTDGGIGVREAAAVLKAGALVGLPTETVYGLAADATQSESVAAIFAAKGRPSFNPLIVHVADTAAAEQLAELGDMGTLLADAFWPGPLTLVAPKRSPSTISDLVTAGLATLAVRVPANLVAQQVLRAIPFPLAAPSANLSGRVSATTALHVLSDLGDQVSLVLDGGPSDIGLESTIVAIGRRPTLLRPGAVSREALEAVIGKSLILSDEGAQRQAPGMLRSHYAPSVPVRLNVTSVVPGESLLAFGTPVANAGEAVAMINLSVESDLVEAATRFFSALRELDDIGTPIAAMSVPNYGLGLAIRDRLRRAAALPSPHSH